MLYYTDTCIGKQQQQKKNNKKNKQQQQNNKQQQRILTNIFTNGNKRAFFWSKIIEILKWFRPNVLTYVCFEQFWPILNEILILYQLTYLQWHLLVPQ